jgi:hypothetical protein
MHCRDLSPQVSYAGGKLVVASLPCVHASCQMICAGGKLGIMRMTVMYQHALQHPWCGGDLHVRCLLPVLQGD